eukprot:7436813-Karenia_brevis.AAC.1
MVRHERTRRKPASEQVMVLEAALLKKRAALQDAKLARERAQALVNDLRLEIEQAEAQLEIAQRTVAIPDGQ